METKELFFLRHAYIMQSHVGPSRILVQHVQYLTCCIVVLGRSVPY